MMYSGSLFWNEVMPRIRTVLREPGEPLASTVTPETLPSSRCSTLVVVCFWRFSTSTVPTAPVISDRRCDVYPVTTTSGNTAMARSSETFIVVRPATPTPDADRHPGNGMTFRRGDFAGDLDLRRWLLAQCSSAHGQGEQHTHPHRAEKVEMPGPEPTLTLEHVVHGGALILRVVAWP